MSLQGVPKLIWKQTRLFLSYSWKVYQNLEPAISIIILAWFIMSLSVRRILTPPRHVAWFIKRGRQCLRRPLNVKYFLSAGGLDRVHKILSTDSSPSSRLLAFLAYLTHFSKVKVGLWYHTAICVYPLLQSLRAWNDLYEICSELSHHLRPYQRYNSQIPSINSNSITSPQISKGKL
jgi:hypothetical protein